MGFFGGYKLKKAVQQILDKPDAGDPETAQAIAALKAGGGSSVPLIMAELADPGAGETFVGILRVLVDNVSLPIVVEGLRSPNARVVTATIAALSVPGRFDANKLIELYTDPQVPATALLKVLGEHNTRLSLTPLLTLLETMPKDKRIGLFRLIEQVVREANVRQVLPLLNTDDPYFRVQVIKLLARIHTTEVRDALVTQLKDPARSVRQAAIEALGSLRVPLDIKPLCDCLRDSDLNVQAQAINTIIRINHPDSVMHLLDILQDESEYVRRAAVEILNEIGNTGAVKNLLNALRDQDWWVRTRAADALGAIGGPKVVDAVLELIRDKDEYIRRFAVEILNMTKDERAAQHLLHALEDPDWWVRERAVDALAALGNKQAIPDLLKLLEHDAKAAPAILRALVVFGDASVVPAVLKQLDAPDKATRKEAMRTLGQLAGREHVGAMQKAMQRVRAQPDAEMRDVAQQVVQTIVARLGEGTRHALEAVAIGTSGSGPDADPDATIASANDVTRTSARPPGVASAGAVGSMTRMVQYIDVAALKAGDLLADRYRVVRPIGRGAFGEVVLVEDQVVSEPVILKFLRPDLTSDKDVMQRFIHELRYARRITHPNVIRIFDLVSIGNTHALSMEFFESVPLSQTLKQGKPDKAQAFRIALDISAGIAAAHQVGVVHRDLKPANVLLNDKGVLKIVDFGLAAVTGAQGDSRLTKTGVIVGTPTYMAPEQVRGEAIDFRTDIYSMGVILYELFTGRPPYQGGDPMAILFQHLEGKATPPSKVSRDVSPSLERIIQKAMSVVPDKRYESMLQLREELNIHLKSGMS